eukprot:TRINITY_DN83220_c0_g1_i1.p1 TRINITY_DN83220_c0_g1~~TRINITY_DN83220_c0_g1_i1.p1  ORF type:complete len:297 (+),score=53.79 TRINITY_DN83220_c0_g1_i1:41-931(+)
MFSFLKGFRSYKSFSGPNDDDASDDRLLVTPHAAWDLTPHKRWSLSGNGIYFKVKLGQKKAKTSGVKGPNAAWDVTLSLPYEGERNAQIVVSHHFHDRPNVVLGSTTVMLTELPTEGLSTDLPLDGVGPGTKGLAGFVSITIQLRRHDSSAPASEPSMAYPSYQESSLVYPDPLPGPSGVNYGPSADDRRAAAAAAAEHRRIAAESRGIGDPARLREMQVRQQREELIGRIQERCAVLREDPPMGLQMASLDQLQAVWKRVRGPQEQLQAAEQPQPKTKAGYDDDAYDLSMVERLD